MTEILFTIQDWITITTALMAAMSPAYYYLWRMNEHMAKLSTIISRCPYCKMNTEHIEVDKEEL